MYIYIYICSKEKPIALVGYRVFKKKNREKTNISAERIIYNKKKMECSIRCKTFLGASPTTLLFT
jgi:hypothetical protein